MTQIRLDTRSVYQIYHAADCERPDAQGPYSSSTNRQSFFSVTALVDDSLGVEIFCVLFEGHGVQGDWFVDIVNLSDSWVRAEAK